MKIIITNTIIYWGYQYGSQWIVRRKEVERGHRSTWATTTPWVVGFWGGGAPAAELPLLQLLLAIIPATAGWLVPGFCWSLSKPLSSTQSIDDRVSPLFYALQTEA